MHSNAIIKTAICSRVILFIIQFIGNYLIEDHDAGVFVSPKSSNSVDLIQKALVGFLRWDAQYFTHIAKYGYTYENTLAFFPLYPLLTSVFSHLLVFIFPSVNIESSVLLTGILLNFFIFILAALSLYRLSKIILLNEDLALKAALLFCCNPATIFFSAPYSETLFAYLTFSGLINVIQVYKRYLNSKNRFDCKDIICLIPFSACTCTRSNGILNIGFLLYFLICFYYEKVKLMKKIKDVILFTSTVFIVLIISISFCLIPFILYQFYAYHLFCKDSNFIFPENVVTYAFKNNLILAGTFSQNKQNWCYQRLPFSYSYIQDHYWNVGFLRYFSLKQLPNFALALPITFLILKCSYEFFKHNPSVVYHPFFSNKKSLKFLPKSTFVFVMHALFLALFNFLCIHVQVSTRILCSASPVLYWYCAFVFKDVPVNELLEFKSTVKLSALQSFIKFYFSSYFVIGTILFCNFLPWT